MQVVTLENEKQNMTQRIQRLEKRLAGLHHGLTIGIRDSAQPPKIIPAVADFTPITDHICPRPHLLCTYCLERGRYPGSDCSCSPQNYPHSGDCKGWVVGKPTYEELKPQVASPPVDMHVDHVCVGKDGLPGVTASCIYCHPELKND